MIEVDYRRGSGELERLFLPFGVKVVKTTLNSGDFRWIGNGPNGPCAVCVERKRIGDLIDSMESRRLSGHQLREMAEEYDFCYLIVEGIWRPGPNGETEVLTGKGSWHSQGVHYRAIDNYLDGLNLRAGVSVWRTGSELETVWAIVNRYRGWTDKLWEDHHCHDEVYTGGVRKTKHFTVPMREIGLEERVAMQLPLLDRRARFAVKEFGSVVGMAEASELEWREMKWVDKQGKVRRLGAVAARKIWRGLRRMK